MGTTRLSNDPIKVYDARWEAGDFGEPEVRRLIEALLLYGLRLGVDTVTLTRDGRLGSSRVLELALEVSLRAGFNVVLCAEPVSTTHSYFLSFRTTLESPNTMGLTITASHNPASYVGLKVTVPPVQAVGLDCGPEGGLSKVRELYHGRQKLQERPGGTLRIVNLTAEYIRFSMEAAGISEGALRGLNVVLDALNGSAGAEIFRALDACGIDIKPLRIVPDGQFPTGAPNPASRGRMDQAVAAAGLTTAAVIGTDGDGDRLVFGNSRGILSAGFASIPVLHSAVRGSLETPKVLHDPKTNPLALSEWKKAGIRPMLFRNGHSQIKDYMRRLSAVAAVEESGHYYHRITEKGLTVFCENSLITILSFLRALMANQKLFDELWRLQHRVFTTGEINFQLESDEVRDRALDSLLGYFSGDRALMVSKTTEGIDLQGTVVSKGMDLEVADAPASDHWYSGYLRIATNEKAVVRIYVSAGDAAYGRRIEGDLREILQQYRAREID
jgi:phosphomannomutase